MIPANVFAYDSLMYDRIWNRVVCGRYERVMAVLDGHVTRKIKGALYPAIIRGEGSVRGVLYFSVSSEDMARLDSFEGKMYERTLCDVMSGNGLIRSCFFYAFREEFFSLLGDDDWNPQEFEDAGICALLADLADGAQE